MHIQIRYIFRYIFQYISKYISNSDDDLPRRWEASVDIWFKEWIRCWSSQVVHIPASINLRIPSGSQY